MVRSEPCKPASLCPQVEAFYPPTRGATRSEAAGTARADWNVSPFETTKRRYQERDLVCFRFRVGNEQLETDGKPRSAWEKFEVELLVVLGETGPGLNGYAVTDFRRPIFRRVTNTVENNKRTLAALVIPARASEEVGNDF